MHIFVILSQQSPVLLKLADDSECTPDLCIATKLVGAFANVMSLLRREGNYNELRKTRYVLLCYHTLYSNVTNVINKFCFIRRYENCTSVTIHTTSDTFLTNTYKNCC